jgi:hypothetical protein
VGSIIDKLFPKSEPNKKVNKLSNRDKIKKHQLKYKKYIDVAVEIGINFSIKPTLNTNAPDDNKVVSLLKATSFSNLILSNSFG